MATPKKSTTKKPAAKKPTTKAAASKSPAKKTVAKATVSKAATKQTRHHRLFALSIVPDDKPFFTFRITTQTVYWLIFAVAIFSLGLWVLKLNLQIAELYNQIDQNNIAESMTSSLHPVAKPAHK